MLAVTPTRRPSCSHNFCSSSATRWSDQPRRRRWRRSRALGTAWWAGIMTTPFSSAGARDGARRLAPTLRNTSSELKSSARCGEYAAFGFLAASVMRPSAGCRVCAFATCRPAGAGRSPPPSAAARLASRGGAATIAQRPRLGFGGCGGSPAVVPGSAIVTENGAMTTDPRRPLPAVDALLAHPTVAGVTPAFGRGPVTAAARHTLDASRRAAALLREVTGAEAGLAVNNAAAALLLCLHALARGREAVVSRGELIEIGGEFRLPAVVEAAGVSLVEVGTTNRTHLADYAAALGERSACVLVVHPSNYRVEGFATRPPLAEVAALAHEHRLPLVHDAGSGLLTGTFGEEPSVAGALAAGADLVLFSGDKLLGGPQAGLIVGRAELVERAARDPVARAVRADKLTLAALEVTLAAHAAGRRDQLPVWRALELGPEDLRPRAAALAARLGAAASLRDGASVAGGGSLPGEGLPSVLLEVDPAPASDAAVLARLRAGDPPVIARAERGRVVVDLRTVPPDQDELVAGALVRALEARPSEGATRPSEGANSAPPDPPGPAVPPGSAEGGGA